MTIKPWLAKNFLQQMTWSSVRDYPPKRKKAWLFDNFMEMEEIHSDHMTAPFNDPGLPLPPNPDIPQTPEDLEPDPCLGDRSLWVVASPSSVDCDAGGGFDLVFSPDFRCIELKQAFFDEDGPKIVDSIGNTLEYPTNVNDIVGSLKLERGCEDAESITIWASDCLCGGQSSVNIDLENCGATCGTQTIFGQSSISPNYQYQYTLDGAQGDLHWFTYGPATGITVDSETGVVTTASNACGHFNLRVTDSCCGDTQRTIIVNVGNWDLISQVSTGCTVCYVGAGDTVYCNTYAGIYRTEKSYWECTDCKTPGGTPCNSTDCYGSPACHTTTATFIWRC